MHFKRDCQSLMRSPEVSMVARFRGQKAYLLEVVSIWMSQDKLLDIKNLIKNVPQLQNEIWFFLRSSIHTIQYGGYC
jgi:hypothetical protein